MTDGKFMAPLNVLFIGLTLACYLLQRHGEDPEYFNSTVGSDFNITFTSKQPIHAGLARASGLKSDVFQHNSGRSKTMIKLLISFLFIWYIQLIKPGPSVSPTKLRIGM